MKDAGQRRIEYKESEQELLKKWEKNNKSYIKLLDDTFENASKEGLNSTEIRLWNPPIFAHFTMLYLESRGYTLVQRTARDVIVSWT